MKVPRASKYLPLVLVIVVVLVLWQYSCKQSILTDREQPLRLRTPNPTTPNYNYEHSTVADRDDLLRNTVQKVTAPPVKIFDLPSANATKFCSPFVVPGKEQPITLCTYDPKHDLISGKVHKAHGFNTPTQRMMFSEMAKHNSASGKKGKDELCFVDIGANMGTYTLAAAALGYRVLAVDAFNYSLELLATSLRLNNLTSRVTMLENVISDEHGKFRLSIVSRESMAMNRILPEGSLRKSLEDTDPIDAVLMDDLIPYLPTRRVFLKMDIESSEARAVRGASKFFQKAHVVGILMEFFEIKHSPADKDTVINFMTSRGYKPYMEPGGPTLLNRPLKDWKQNVFWL
ncbi:hypothetical protein BaRGS_00026043 [Batillaria attramentaria]|uniref:Methyltransferase FkbM domain-containing protein n=1 Tax=Batillaria attramentaria TaxID=370345 RepID=A0ABD0K7B7_9CAEN